MLHALELRRGNFDWISSEPWFEIKIEPVGVPISYKSQDGSLFQSSFDENLGELQVERDSLSERIKRALVSCASELGLEPDKVLKLEQSGQHGYFFRLTMKEEKSVRNDRSFTIIEANKTGVKFRNKKLDQLVSSDETLCSVSNPAQ